MINSKIETNSKVEANFKKNLQVLFSRDGIGVFALLIVLFLFLSIASPVFLTMNNIANLLVQSVFIMIIALGVMFVLATGGIDLSVGSVLGLSGGITGWMMMSGTDMWLAVLAGLCTGLIIGIVNGIIITKLRVSAFLVTFAMLYIARGLLMLLTKEDPIRGFATQEFVFLAQGKFMGIPMAVVITFIIFVLAYFVYNSTSFGRYITVLGTNEEAARLSGISTDKLKISVYAISGLLAATAGILLASRLTSVQPLMGNGYELEAIAAAVIGGTSMFGGKASVVGVAIGALILALVLNGLDLLGVNQFYRLIITGVIIIIAVGIDRYISRES